MVITGHNITAAQLKRVLAYAVAIGDRELAACARRALDGDSIYNHAMRERCSAAHAKIERILKAIAPVKNRRAVHVTLTIPQAAAAANACDLIRDQYEADGEDKREAALYRRTAALIDYARHGGR